MTIKQEFTVDDLRRLAESRDYRLVTKNGHFWLVSRKDRLPEVNEVQQSLLFTATEAREMLEGLSRTRQRR
jgi:hypothetical protein